ncbi:MAG TPA: PfkB family carbohydrate kinase [Phycisphaerae bacterium]|nr:PfkB family carbohydrate kinase [Phycisphaerae bacterium]
MNPDTDYTFLVGVGGIGTGTFWALEGNRTLARNESRAGRILPRRDFCKLHIIAHYVAVLTGRGRQGFAVVPVGKVGDDEPGRRMLALMAEAGMDTRFVATTAEAPTMFSTCFIYPDGDGGNVTTADSACARLTPEDVERAVEAMPETGGVALAAPEVPLPARRRLLELARQRRWPTAAALNTADVAGAMADGLLAMVDILSVNRDEAAAIAGMDPGEDPVALAEEAGRRLGRGNPSIRLCVTAGAAGAVGWEGGRIERTPAAAVEPVNTAGAGDATLAALIVAEAADLPFILPDRPGRSHLAERPLATALDLGAILAGISVTAEDTIHFGADAEAILRLAEELGADATGLAPALRKGKGPSPIGS